MSNNLSYQQIKDQISDLKSAYAQGQEKRAKLHPLSQEMKHLNKAQNDRITRLQKLDLMLNQRPTWN